MRSLLVAMKEREHRRRRLQREVAVLEQQGVRASRTRRRAARARDNESGALGLEGGCCDRQARRHDESFKRCFKDGSYSHRASTENASTRSKSPAPYRPSLPALPVCKRCGGPNGQPPKLTGLMFEMAGYAKIAA